MISHRLNCSICLSKSLQLNVFVELEVLMVMEVFEEGGEDMLM
jgi:hypothetical protein